LIIRNCVDKHPDPERATQQAYQTNEYRKGKANSRHQQGKKKEKSGSHQDNRQDQHQDLHTLIIPGRGVQSFKRSPPKAKSLQN
jgi:hypothetical protein